MKFLKLTAAAAALAVAPGAYAQNFQLNQATPVISATSSQWVIDFFAGRNFSAAVIEQTAETETIEVTAPSGAVIYVVMRVCDGAAPKQCSMIQPFALFDGSGLTLNHINTMSREKFALSYAYLREDGTGVIASKIVLAGGVTEGNVVEELAGYFYDLDNLIESIQSGQLATVSFKADHEAAGLSRTKIDNASAESVDYAVNAVGPNAPKFMTDEFRALVD